MLSQCTTVGKWSRLKRGSTEPSWSTPSKVIQDTQTSLASYFSGCLRYAALACRLRTICTSATLLEIYPATLYLRRCYMPSTTKRMLQCNSGVDSTCCCEFLFILYSLWVQTVPLNYNCCKLKEIHSGSSKTLC